MADASRGRRRLLTLLGVYLAAVGWASVRRDPPSDSGHVFILVGLWVVLPVVLALRAGLGASWARRGLAVMWGLRGVLELEVARSAIAQLDQGGSLEAAVTASVLAVGCLLGAAVVLVQRDIREMTRPR
jgi:hypothetical protein